MGVIERMIVGAGLGPGPRTVVSSPFHFQVESTDAIRIRLWFKALRTWPLSSRVFSLVVRTVRLDGTTQVSALTMAPIFELLVNPFRMPLEAGTVQTVSLSYAGGVLTTMPGLAYASVDLVRGTPPGPDTVIGTFLAGYVGPGLPLTWPGSPILGPLEGPGYLFADNQVPAVGDEASGTFLAGIVQHVRMVTATYTASATVAARRPRLRFTINGQSCGLWSSPQDITAGQVVDMTWMPGAALGVGSPLRDGVAPMPADIILRGTDSFTTSTVARQVDDAYSNFAIVSSFYLEPLP